MTKRGRTRAFLERRTDPMNRLSSSMLVALALALGATTIARAQQPTRWQRAGAVYGVQGGFVGPVWSTDGAQVISGYPNYINVYDAASGMLTHRINGFWPFETGPE